MSLNICRYSIFCLLVATFCLLITFVNSFGPDHTRQNVWSDLDPICLNRLILKRTWVSQNYLELVNIF